MSNKNDEKRNEVQDEVDVGLFGIAISDGMQDFLKVIWWLIFIILIICPFIPQFLNARR
ncbi:MAG TPA: hypothetical protein VGB30_10945 [bacterium]|jgi:hypothetical protein